MSSWNGKMKSDLSLSFLNTVTINSLTHDDWRRN